jgi:hypothetical protein
VRILSSAVSDEGRRIPHAVKFEDETVEGHQTRSRSILRDVRPERGEELISSLGTGDLTGMFPLSF